MNLPQTQRAALTDLAAHTCMRRCPGPGYRVGKGAGIHSSRAAHALVRAGLAEWSDGESELRITTAGRNTATQARA
jgi:hypothetical protein